MTINADVYDLRKYGPLSGDQFLVDANVLFWTSYSKASLVCSADYQAIEYPKFVSSVLTVCKRTGLYYCSITLAEVLHVVEKSEKDLFCDTQTQPCRMTIKFFRENHPIEWSGFCDEIKTVIIPYLKQFNEITTTVDATLNESMLKQIAANKVDVYDCYMVATGKINKKIKIITDDKDIARFNDIEVYTANENLIRTAKTAGKLKN